MSWFTDAHGYPRPGRIGFAIGCVGATIGWALAIWVDPGAINMAVGGMAAAAISGIAALIGRRSL